MGPTWAKIPIWDPHGSGPTWVQFGHHALILPIWDPFAHACWVNILIVYIYIYICVCVEIVALSNMPY